MLIRQLTSAQSLLLQSPQSFQHLASLSLELSLRLRESSCIRSEFSCPIKKQATTPNLGSSTTNRAPSPGPTRRVRPPPWPSARKLISPASTLGSQTSSTKENTGTRIEERRSKKAPRLRVMTLRTLPRSRLEHLCDSLVQSPVCDYNQNLPRELPTFYQGSPQIRFLLYRLIATPSVCDTPS